MTKKYFGYFLAGAAVGYAAGYVVCWWNRPIPQLVVDNKPITQAPAKALLNTGDAIQKIRPALVPLAQGDIPTPKVLYDMIRGV